MTALTLNHARARYTEARETESTAWMELAEYASDQAHAASQHRGRLDEPYAARVNCTVLLAVAVAAARDANKARAVLKIVEERAVTGSRAS